MTDILANPQNWFIAAAFVGIGGIGYLAYEIASFHYRRLREDEIDFDFEAMQRELDDEFGGTGTEAGVLRTL